MIHNTHFTRFIPLSAVKPTVGVWALTPASNVWTLDHTAGNDTSILHIPLDVPQNSIALQGSRLASIDVWYSIATAPCDAVSADLKKVTLPANGGSAPAAVAVPCTYDAGHDTPAERLASGVHKMTLTLDTPVFLDDDDQYHVELTVDAALTSVVKILGVRANFTLRA